MGLRSTGDLTMRSLSIWRPEHRTSNRERSPWDHSSAPQRPLPGQGRASEWAAMGDHPQGGIQPLYGLAASQPSQSFSAIERRGPKLTKPVDTQQTEDGLRQQIVVTQAMRSAGFRHGMPGWLACPLCCFVPDLHEWRQGMLCFT